MIGVIGYVNGRREEAIYERILRYSGAPESFQLFDPFDPLPDSCRTAILLDDYNSQLTKQHAGRYIPIWKARGYRFQDGTDGRIYIPTFSPKILGGAHGEDEQGRKKQKMEWFPMSVWDFKTALKTDGTAPPAYPLDDLELNPSPSDFENFCASAGSSEFLVVDLETPGKGDIDDKTEDYVTTIVRASFAYFDGKVHAITFPWMEPYINIACAALDAPIPKVWWNGAGFDRFVLEENKIVVGGELIDAMWLQHFLQPTLPKSLGAVTTLYADVPEWKSLNNDEPELYSAMDAWAEAVSFMGIRQALQRRGVWELAQRHVTQILEILDKMRRRGVRVRQQCEVCTPGEICCLDAFNKDCDRQMDEMRALFNEHPDLKPLRGWHPKQKDGTFGYVKSPADTEGLEQIETPHGVRWARRKPFLPTSSDQVQLYFDSKGYSYSNADEKTLAKLAKDHDDPLLREFIKYRKLGKMRGTYGGYPIVNEKIHTTFTLRPDTHRFSSIRPNMQNVPPAFKKILVPSPGCRFIEVDKASVEAVLTGFFAGDPEYIRRAKIGIHKIAMAQYLGYKIDFSLPDAEIKKIVKPMKDLDEKLYRKIKTIIYGGNYLAGARTTFKKNPEDFASEAEVKQFMKYTKGLSPRIPAWQRRTVEQAARQHGLTNPFGYYKAFWGGEHDGPAACAFLPQSTVAAIMKEDMLALNQMEAGQYMILQVHDSLVFDTPEDRIDAVIAEIEEVFNRSWPQLGGMTIGYEIKVGDSLKFE